MATQKIGTLLCRLVGHKFMDVSRIIDRDTFIVTIQKHATDYCVRCGVERQAKEKDAAE